MMRIAHIVNPFAAGTDSDLVIAQPITFATMRAAASFRKEDIEVSLLAAQYPEDRASVPEGFLPTPDLDRSVLDVRGFRIPRKLPLIRDILDRLFHGSEARLLIYTNVDIALQPYFYAAAAALFQKGCDAFVINRRTIPASYKTLEKIPLMMAEAGEAHPGWDCFAFDRSLYPDFDLGTACIGSGWIGRVMIANMAALAKKFAVFSDWHATFHIGNDKIWKASEFDDYIDHNRDECRRILTHFDEKKGPFDRNGFPGKFFLKLEREG